MQSCNNVLPIITFKIQLYSHIILLMSMSNNIIRLTNGILQYKSWRIMLVVLSQEKEVISYNYALYLRLV